MIRSRRAPYSYPAVVAWLAVTWLSVPAAQAAEDHHAPTPKPAAPPASAHNVEAPAAAEKHGEEKSAKEEKPQATAGKAAVTEADETQSLLKLGGSLTERGDYEAAEIAYRQILKSPRVSDQDTKTALLGLAQMHRRQGALTKAVAIYERYLKDYPGDERTPDALLNLGRTLRTLGTHKLAIARFYSVINSTLKLPGEGFERYQVLAKTAQFEIAETHFQAGEFAEANKFYTRLRLLDLAPVDRARAHFKAGYSLRLQGDKEGAIKTLRAFVEQYPQDENVPEARYLLAITLRELNRTQEAFAATLDLLRTEKSKVDADPKRWQYWQRKTGNQLANEFFETGDTMNARAIYAGLLELSPEPTWRLPITYQLGLCYERLGVVDQARASYQTIIDGAGATPPADLKELATMAKWRIDHLEWRDGITRQISSLESPKPATTSPGPATPLKTASTP